MEKRMTKKDYFKAIIAELGEGHEALVAFCEKEIETLGKRKTAKTATQKENEVLVEELYEVIAGLETPATISDIMKVNEKFGEMSNQKVSALAKKLVDAGRVVKTSDKKKSYFSVAE